jgi:superfamily II RNA helicase
MEHPTAPLARSLASLNARGDDADRDEILNRFLDYVADLGIEPYAAQEEAILELLSWKHVILNTPTGSGKSLVALALHFQAMAEDRVSYYTAPTKALVNEKFFSLCDAFGPGQVGLLTGDASVNRDAPIICCTAEILSNMALRQDDVGVEYVVMDEFHYYGDRDRGVAWQIPLITMKDTMFLLMSATLGDTRELEERLQLFSDREVAVVRGGERPVPLEYAYRETLLHETIEELLSSGESPIYLVNFTQKACAEQAQNLTSLNVASKEEKRTIGRELEGVTFDSPYGKEFQRFVRHGLGVHHAGLLPKYRRVVERLSQSGLIKVISGTDTLGVGVNIPIRSVVLRQLYKFDGEKNRLLSARQFHQIAGRAGRKGFDDHGQVVVQAPEWVIENRRLEQKIRKQPHLKKKIVKKRPPPGAVSWDEKTFDRMVASPPEPLTPRFEVGTGMLVNLLQADNIEQPGGGYRRLIELIDRIHGKEGKKKRHRRHAAALVRSLRQAGLVELRRPEEGGPMTLAVRPGLQQDFSLHHTLSLYLVQTLGLLDQQSDTYAVEALTLVEAILENPKVILFRQIDRLKGELVARLKAEGVEYEERMAELEKVDHPKPQAEFIYETFEAFAGTHPWVGTENIRPKSIAREMYEQCHSFNEYVLLYGLARSEGVLLRYLMQVYKTAVQAVPEEHWTGDFEDILAFLHGLVRRTDSSLVQEWRLLVAGPGAHDEQPDVAQVEHPWDIAEDLRAFRARVRNELHVLVKALADQDYEKACTMIRPSADQSWDAETLAAEMAPYYEEYEYIDITPRARQAHNTFLREEEPHHWTAHQKILDPEGNNEWAVECHIDLTRPRDDAMGEPLLDLRRIRG